jgi:hypothetical protein
MKAGVQLFVGLLLGGVAFASSGSRVTGLVRDPSGAIVANARVTLVSATKAVERSAWTHHTGAFDFPNLGPGAWELTVEAAGFKRFHISSVLTMVDQTTRADVTLQVGDVTETIEVRSVMPLIERDSATASMVIDRRAIPSLPLNGRQYLDLAALAPGTLPAAPGTQGNGFNVSGIRSQSNVYLLDGVSNVDTQNNQPLNLFRIADAVDEFSVQTSVSSSEFGRGAGAQVNVVTRSGGNQLRGAAFEYLRNTAITAADFFTNKLAGPKNALNRNQFGANSGGPLWRSRTFFFGSYEGFRQVAPAVSAVLVPSEAQRASVADPIAQRLLAYFPLPNTSGALNYIANVRSLDSDNTGLVRIDHRAGQDQISARWTQYWGTSIAPGPTPLTGGNRGPLSQLSAMFSEEHTFASRLLNELRIGESRYSVERTVQDAGVNTAAILTVPGVPVNAGLPFIVIGGGFASLGSNANFPQGRVSNTTEIFDNMSLPASRHSFRWGFHIRREDLSRYLNRAARGTINFANFADFSRGQINTATFRTGSTQSYWRRHPWDWYWLDEFRVRPNLTLHFGVRYEFPSAVRERRGRATNFVPGYGPMLVGTDRILDIDPTLTGPASFVYRTATFRLPAAGVFADRNNWAPTLGFAYGKQSTVIRGGVRVAYDDLFNNVPSAMALTAPHNLQTTQTANVTQPARFGWALAFNQDVPLVANAGRQGPGTPTTGVLSFQGVDPNLRSAFAYVYHLGVQRLIGKSLAVEVDYRGSSGHALGMYLDHNQPAVLVRDPARRGPVAPNEQIFPYNHYGQAQVASSIGGSNYNGVVATARRREGRVLVEASYTLGKSLDYNSSYFGSGNLPGEPGAPIDSRNVRLEHAASAFDVRQRFVLLYAIDVPGPQGRGLSHVALAGWRVSGIAAAQSGSPFTVVLGGPDTSGFNQATAGNSPNGGNRPDVVKNGPLPQDNRAPDAAFDTSWFAPNGPGRNGTSGRNAYRGPGLQNLDFSVAKSFSIAGKDRGVTLQFRADFFNLLNHTNFAHPIADLNNANFGKLTQTAGSAVGTSTGTSGGAAGGPRIVQMALRLQF